ncbi:uncharacterized protein LOC105771679 [Gossypium raimondii]|uniref:uncharacterized protein LOC105771679 n=1 Tax=Gossypium raimondii TaxID=29730 RepID=UPI00063AE9FA|nr:uncharacterized protein LOC105771679 [Gossypium raimondii]
MQKILVSAPKKYEAKIASWKNTKDLTQLRVMEFISALQAQEQRRLMRQEGSIKEALKAKMSQCEVGEDKKWNGKKSGGNSGSKATKKGNGIGNSNKYSSCKYSGKQNHPHFRCWRQPDVKCRSCNLIRHIEKFCKESRNQQYGETHAVIKEKENQLFGVSYFSSGTPCDSWLVDSGCTNYMTCDEKLFKDIDRLLKSRVRIGNGEYLEVKGKSTVVIESCARTNLILDVLFVPKIDQNLLSVGKLVEKKFKVMFEEGICLILDSSGNKLFRIKMQNKSFTLNPFKVEQVASKCREGMTSDQTDLLAEQVKVLVVEIAFSSNTLKYLLDQFANDPNSSKSQLQNLERGVQEKRNQMRAFENT